MSFSIAVIAKECVPGRVKTRLTPPLDPAAAAALAQTSLSQTLAMVRSLPANRRLLVLDGEARPEDAAGFEVHPQTGGGLDARLAGVCALTAGPLLILGMDTPQATAADLALLLRHWSPAPGRLETGRTSQAAVQPEAWLGMATDGGFWALALDRPDGSLLRGVPMSTSHTGRDQALRIESTGVRLRYLPTLTDVDDAATALEVAALCPGTPFAAHVELLKPLLRSAGSRTDLVEVSG